MFDPRDDAHEREGLEDGRARVYYDRDRDAVDGLMRDLDLPRGEERELVVDRERIYELDGEDSRTLATVGAFRVVPEHDLDTDHDVLEHLRDEGLVEAVDLGDDERGLTLSREGRELLDSHSIGRDDERSQAFYAGVSRERELDHDSNLYATYRQEEARLRDEHDGLEVLRIVLEQDLKREYQEFLQAHNRGRSGSDGRPDRDEHEIREWARDHDLPFALRQEFRKQGMAKIQALYRAWRRQGDRVLWDASSTTLADDRSLGLSTVEVELLNRQYLQLAGAIERDRSPKRGAKRKSRQVGPPVSTASADPLSSLVGHERESSPSA
jgi:hypothetical protein